MWGVKLTKNRAAYVTAAQKMFAKKHYMRNPYDQMLLQTHVWPVARSSLVTPSPPLFFGMSRKIKIKK